MEEFSPLSPKANAFSIASLISASEEVATEEPSAALDKLYRFQCHPMRMHFSAVTRDMEGKCPHQHPTVSLSSSQG